MTAQERAEAAAQAKDAANADLADLMDSEMDLNAEMGNVLAALESLPTGGKGLSALGASLASPAMGGARKSALDFSLPSIKVKEQATDSAESRGSLPSGLAPLQIRTSAMPSSLKKSPAPGLTSSGLSPRQQAEALQKKAQALQQKKPAESALAKSPPKSKYPKAPGSKYPVAPGPKTSVATAASAPKAPQPPVAPARAAKAPAPAKSASSLSDDRIRALHQSYCDARTQTNARTVSFEKLSHSIRETEAKIRAQNKGRSVDFEVTIQGGKAILKPQLK
jgi:hypothetical protein